VCGTCFVLRGAVASSGVATHTIRPVGGFSIARRPSGLFSSRRLNPVPHRTAADAAPREGGISAFVCVVVLFEIKVRSDHRSGNNSDDFRLIPQIGPAESTAHPEIAGRDARRVCCPKTQTTALNDMHTAIVAAGFGRGARPQPSRPAASVQNHVRDRRTAGRQRRPRRTTRVYARWPQY